MSFQNLSDLVSYLVSDPINADVELTANYLVEYFSAQPPKDGYTLAIFWGEVYSDVLGRLNKDKLGKVYMSAFKLEVDNFLRTKTPTRWIDDACLSFANQIYNGFSASLGMDAVRRAVFARQAANDIVSLSEGVADIVRKYLSEADQASRRTSANPTE